MPTILVTGGAGFVGSSLAIRWKQDEPRSRVLVLDNLKRRGSELNLPRLKKAGLEFIHGDVRNPEDLDSIGPVDLILECSAEPSVLAGFNSSPQYVVHSNLVGTVHCLELARRYQSGFIFLSTSRVYPYETLNQLPYEEAETRFVWIPQQKIPGADCSGIRETFPLSGLRSLYGTTKLAAELLIEEYSAMYGFQYVINRFGVIGGPWQMGKADQGLIALWVARHYYEEPLSYIGFNGTGKQVRDILDIEDVYRLLRIQAGNLKQHHGQIYNAGGGLQNAVSLLELTALCEEMIHSTPISRVSENRPADVRIYITDNTKVTQATGWKPEVPVSECVGKAADWVKNHAKELEHVLRG